MTEGQASMKIFRLAGSLLLLSSPVSACGKTTHRIPDYRATIRINTNALEESLECAKGFWERRGWKADYFYLGSIAGISNLAYTMKSDLAKITITPTDRDEIVEIRHYFAGRQRYNAKDLSLRMQDLLNRDCEGSTPA